MCAARTRSDSKRVGEEYPGYRIEAELGRGRHGTVYRAVDLLTRTPVALKRLRVASAENIYRLKREFRTVAEIRHPSLLRMHQLVVKPGRAFFTMELVDGPDVLEWVHVQPYGGTADSFRVRRTAQVVADLADALAVVHGAGHAHRDIKPSNVRIALDGRAVLLDFGLAELIDHGRPPHADVAGSVLYMAPEAVWSDQPSAAADVFSLGVVAVECLTGAVPFGGSFIEMDRRKRAGFSGLAECAPSWLSDLLRSMLSPNADERPTALEVSDRIRAQTSVRALGVYTPPLIGRSEPMAELLQAYEQHGDDSLLFRIVGAAGIGKSHFVRAFCARVAQLHGARILSNRCLPIASVPLPGLDGVVDALTQELRMLDEDQLARCTPEPAQIAALLRVFPVFGRVRAFCDVAVPEQATSDPFELRNRAFAALRTLLHGFGREVRLIIWLDDMQWSDRDSLAFWKEFLGSRFPGLLIVAARAAAGTMPAALSDWSHAHRADIMLERLYDREIDSLVRHVVQREPSVAELEAVKRESGGNPLLALEFATHESSSSRRPEEAAISLGGLLQQRLVDLGPDARQILELACLAIAPLSLSTLADAACVSRPGPALLELLRAGRLVEQAITDAGMMITPYHDRIREAVVGALSAEQLRANHLALALELSARTEADPVATFWHWHGAGDLPLACKYALRAGDRLMESLAFNQAADLYELALEASTNARQRSDAHQKLTSARDAALRGTGSGH